MFMDLYCRRNGVVGIAAKLRSGVRIPVGKVVFLFAKMSRQAIHRLPRFLPGLKRPA